jgi:hypothetical protein
MLKDSGMFLAILQHTLTVTEGLIMAILEAPIKSVPKIKNYVDGEWVESKG